MPARRRLASDVSYRSCSRCGQELTDPASRECGVGPVCRKKDNHLFAKLIAANIPMAGVHLMGIHVDDLPVELEERFEKFKDGLVERFSHIQSTNDDPSNFNISGEDFREEIRTLDYFLSYRTSSNTRQSLISIVRAMGYVGLAAVLSGEASKSKAQLWFEDGRVYLQGTGCTPGWKKMSKIPGITTPRFRGEKAPYSAPAAGAGIFLDIVIEHWPLYDADLDSIRSLAEQWIKNNPQLVKEETRLQNALACITKRSHDFVLSFPWSDEHDTRGMIGKLKSVSPKERSYHSDTKNWLFRPAHLKRIVDIVTEHFGDCPVTLSNEQTPGEQWVKFNPYANKRSSRKRYNGYHC